MSINGQASTVFANTISGLDSLNVSNITVNGVDLTATYVPYQNANSDVNLGIRNLTATTITATTSMITPTPTLSDNSTLVSTTQFVKSQGYIGTAGLANYALLTGATFTGYINTLTIHLVDNSTIVATTAFVKGQNYITSSALTPYSLLSGATFVGAVFVPTSSYSDNSDRVATTNYVRNQGYLTSSSLSGYALLSGSTFTGNVFGLTATFSDNDTKFATTAYVKGQNYATSSALSNYALLSGATFTGIVYGLTATLTDNDTKFATTAYVKGQNYITSSALTPYALLASPTFTGAPSAPTPSTVDNTTKIATTAYVKNNLASYAPLTNATFTTPFRVNGSTSGSFIVDSLGDISCGSIVGGSDCEFAGFTIRGGGFVNPVTSLLGIDANGKIWKSGSAASVATLIATPSNINYYLVGSSATSGNFSVASIDSGNSFYFNPFSAILFTPSITTTSASSIFGYLTTASASSTYLTIANASSTYLPLSGGTIYDALGPTLKITTDVAGATKYSLLSIVVSAGAFYTGSLVGDSIIQAYNNCYHGVGASKSHKFYVNSSNRLEIDSAKTVITGQLGVNTTAPIGALSILLNGLGTNSPNGSNAWDVGYALFGPGSNSTTGSAVALTYNTASNYGCLVCLTPGVAWRDMHYSANSHLFKLGNTNLMTIDNGGNVVASGSITSNGTLTAPNFTASSGIFTTLTNTLQLNGGSTGAKWGQIHMNNGAYNLIMRQDTESFYLLIGSNPDGQWNGLRPFAITLSSGLLWSENGQRLSGGTEISTSCILSSGVPLRMATGNGDTGIAMELASSTTPLLNLQSNFRGTYNTAYLGACFRIDTRNAPLYQWLYRPPSSGTENMIMNLNSAGDLGCSTLTLSSASQQTYSPKQVLIGQNGSVLQYGQLESFSFICGGAGFGWGPGLWMNTNMGQYNNLVMVIPNRMVKNSASSAITITGTWSGYVGANLMICSVYLYNYFAGSYYFVGNGYQYQNIGGNHAVGGFTKTIPGGTLAAGEYVLYLQSNFGTATDTNDYCTFNAIIHP
jgi:hypothetical protein